MKHTVIAVTAMLVGNWLNDPANLNGNWTGPVAVTHFAVESNGDEIAMIYRIAHPIPLTEVRFSGFVDNGVHVWVNGAFQFGTRDPYGLPFSYLLADLPAGTNYIQILHEDDSGLRSYHEILLTATEVPDLEPPTWKNIGC